MGAPPAGKGIGVGQFVSQMGGSGGGLGVHRLVIGMCYLSAGEGAAAGA